MEPKLILKHDGVNLRTYPLDKDVVTVGRKADNDIQLDDGAISGLHAQFIKQASEYLDGHFDIYIEDLGSTNGTMLNGKQVEKQLLKHGDIVEVGKHKLTFDSGQEDVAETAIYLPDN